MPYSYNLRVLMESFVIILTLFAVDVIEEVDGVLDDAVAHVAVVAGRFKNERLIFLNKSNI